MIIIHSYLEILKFIQSKKNKPQNHTYEVSQVSIDSSNLPEFEEIRFMSKRNKNMHREKWARQIDIFFDRIYQDVGSTLNQEKSMKFK